MAACGKAGLDLEVGAVARGEGADGRDPAAGDEVRAREAGLERRDDETAARSAHSRQPVELATHALERGDSILQPPRVLEPPRIGEVAQLAPQAWQRAGRMRELIRTQRARRDLRAPVRAQ